MYEPAENPVFTFSTPIVDRREGRVENLKLSAAAVNGTRVQPGELFSFNETVGPRTSKRGYKPGNVFIQGEKVDKIGGGICQVTTTLYNAAVSAGWHIAERHDHGESEVSYIEDGKDATVYYGELDLKIRNNSAYEAVLECSVGDDDVFVRIVYL
jgi:vancomycin resistance protein YoaR